ncbi:MAG: menaquinone biosynthesis protein [Planctomycetota bacterium]
MLRVGTVPYLVGRPVDCGLEDERDIELVKQVPARLVEGLRTGSIDVALVSTVELFRRPGYGYLDRFLVAGRGHVSSVQVFLRKPEAEVRSVALDPASRAAASLTQVVWPGERPEFREVPPEGDPRAAGTDAWLRIGDVALTETFEPDAKATFNPSARWTELTGLPFAFAVWIVRPDVDVTPYRAAFERASERGRERREDYARETATRLGVPLEAARRYFFDEIDYAPEPDELREALTAFHRRACAIGLASEECVPTAIPALAPGVRPQTGGPRA